jgi:hypothetical protein
VTERRGSGGGGCGGIGVGVWVLGPRVGRAALEGTGTAAASSAWRIRLATLRLQGSLRLLRPPSPPRMAVAARFCSDLQLRDGGVSN